MAYIKTNWKDYPDTSTPITAEALQNIEDGIEALDGEIGALDGEIGALEDGIEDVDNRLSDEEIYTTATAGNNGDFYVTLSNTTLTNRVVKISFPAATNPASNARLSIDGGSNYKNTFVNGIQSLANEVQNMSLILRYDGTNWVIKNQIEITRTGIEIETNEFVDGKRVYKKRIDLGFFPNASLKQIAHGLGAVNFVKIETMAFTSTIAVALPFSNPTAINLSIVVYVLGANIEIVTGLDRTAWFGYTTLYYTKN